MKNSMSLIQQYHQGENEDQDLPFPKGDQTAVAPRFPPHALQQLSGDRGRYLVDEALRSFGGSGKLYGVSRTPTGIKNMKLMIS